jgi:hypothetical protein
LLTASSNPGEKSLITAVIAQLLFGKQVSASRENLAAVQQGA